MQFFVRSHRSIERQLAIFLSFKNERSSQHFGKMNFTRWTLKNKIKLICILAYNVKTINRYSKSCLLTSQRFCSPLSAQPLARKELSRYLLWPSSTVRCRGRQFRLSSLSTHQCLHLRDGSSHRTFSGVAGRLDNLIAAILLLTLLPTWAVGLSRTGALPYSSPCLSAAHRCWHGWIGGGQTRRGDEAGILGGFVGPLGSGREGQISRALLVAGHPVPWGVGSTPGLHLLDASSTPNRTAKLSPDFANGSLEGHLDQLVLLGL